MDKQTTLWSGKIELPLLPDSVEITGEYATLRERYLATARGLETIACQQDYSTAEILLKQITAAGNGIEKVRKALAKPFSDAAGRIKKVADDWCEPLELHKIRLKSLMAAYLTEEERKKREAEATARETEAITAEDDPFGAADSIPALVSEEPVTFRAMSSVRKVWEFVIVNPELVPRQFCTPDERKIREFLKDYDVNGAVPEIFGVEVKQITKVQSR